MKSLKLFFLAAAALVAVGCAKAPTSISISPSSVSLTEGETAALTANVLPADASYDRVVWTSSDTGIAKVSSDGLVTAVKAGSTTVTASAGSVSATASITVKQRNIAVESVDLDIDFLEFKVGESTTIVATVKPDNATDKSVTWSSSDESVVKVDGSGKLTAVGEGEADVTVKTVDGGKTAVCKVTVTSDTPAELVGLSINPESVKIKEGETMTLEVIFDPYDYPDQGVQWASYDKNIAYVDEYSVLHAVKPGSTTVSVKSFANPSVQASCDVTVTQDMSLKGIELTASSIELALGESRTLTVIYTPEYAENKEVQWSSSDSSVASVDGQGTVTARKMGECVITATSSEGGFTASCSVKVKMEEGTKVAWHTTEGSYINGEPFNMFGIKELYGIFENDGDIYIYDGSLYKNGEEVARMPLRAMSFAGVANGWMLLYDSEYLYVVDIETCDVLNRYYFKKGQYNYHIYSAGIGPDGTVYACGMDQDAFGVNCAMLWKVAPGAEPESYALGYVAKDATAYDMTVSDNGDTYVAVRAYDESASNSRLQVYKNGKFLFNATEDYPTGNHSHYVSVYGEDVYVSVTAYSQREVSITKNGKELYRYSSEEFISSDSKILKASDGSLYYAVIKTVDGEDYALVYRDDKVIYTTKGYVVYYFTIME